jgi:hypothetical protein
MNMMDEVSDAAVAEALKYGFVKDDKVYIKPYLGFAERQIGEVKNSEQFSLQYFRKRFELISAKVSALVAAISEAQNKGSYLMKLIHLREQLGEYDALGDFAPLFDQLAEAENQIRGLIEVNRVKNLEIKTALLAEIEEVVATVTDWSAGSIKIKDLRDKWLKTGSVERELEEQIEGKFTDLLNLFYERRKLFFEERARLIALRVEHYGSLVTKAQAIFVEQKDDNGAAWLKTFQALQTEWKTVGAVPKLQFDPLIQAFKEANKRVMRRVKDERPKRPLTPEQIALINNMKAKEEMIREAFGLAKIDLREAFGRAKELQAKWKDIGNVPENHKRRVNEQFTYSCDRIFEMSYLMRTVYVQYRFFNSKSPAEQYTIKINLMKEIIRKDELELADFEGQMAEVPEPERMQPENKQLYNKIKTQSRKLRVKKILMQEMQEQLTALAQ